MSVRRILTFVTRTASRRAMVPLYQRSFFRRASAFSVQTPVKSQPFHALRYASKSRLRALVENVKPNDEKLSQLISAIANGNHKNAIFSDPNCEVYLAYLIEKKHITKNQGMTLHAYLAATAQFVNKAGLRSEDQDTFRDKPIEVVRLSENGELTDIGKRYMENISDRFCKINYKIHLKKLREYIIKMPPSEQWLLKIPHKADYTQLSQLNDVDYSTCVLLWNMPFVMHAPLDRLTFVDYYAPSATLIEYFLECVAPGEHVTMDPIYGSVREETTWHAFHEKGAHPVALYSPNVKSNPKDADGYRCGPFLLWLHDIGHVYWGSLLSKEEREFIYREFMPALAELKQKALDDKDPEFAKFIQGAMDQGNSFDLTPELYFKYKEERLFRYLLKALKHTDISIKPIEEIEISSDMSSRLCLLLWREHSHKDIWSHLFDKIVCPPLQNKRRCVL